MEDFEFMYNEFKDKELFIDQFVEWMLNNPDEFKKKYPELDKRLTIALTSNNYWPDFMWANLIGTAPKNIIEQLKKIEAITINRIKETKKIELLNFIDFILNKEFDNETIEAQRQKIIQELLQIKEGLTKSKDHKIKTTYKWPGNAEKELPELYSLMMGKYKLIAPETTYEQFRAIFTRQPIESINPIKWTESNRLLAYFLDSVFNGQNWQSIAGNGGLFLNKKGLKISANDLSVAKKGYIDFGKPKDYEKIDLILKTIKKHSEH